MQMIFFAHIYLVSFDKSIGNNQLLSAQNIKNQKIARLLIKKPLMNLLQFNTI